MVKKIALLLLMMLLPLAALADYQIIDDANILDDSAEQSILDLIQKIEQEHQMDIVVLTTTDTPQDYTESMYYVRDFADTWYEQHGCGMGADNSGLLLLVDMHNRIVWLSTGGVMIDYITEGREDAILDACYNYLTYGDYGNGVHAAIAKVAAYLDQGRQEGSFRYDEATGERLSGLHNSLTGTEMLIAAAAGIGTALIIAGSVKGSYSLSGSTYSYNRHANSTMDMTRDEETYLRQTVTRTARHQAPPGGGSAGGGSRPSSGSGVHRSSGGVSHGGGGRRF